MRTLERCLPVVLSLTLSACGLSTFAEPKANPVLEDRVGKWFRQPVASLATTSERRVVLVRIDKDDKESFGKFCSEPPPDSAESIANSVALAIEATVKTSTPVEGSGKFDLAKQLATSVQELFHRTQGLQLYRDGAFNLCQRRLNGFIDNAEYQAGVDKLFSQAVTLIALELNLTSGLVGSPSRASLPSADMAELPQARPRTSSSWTLARRWIVEFKNAKGRFVDAQGTDQQKAEAEKQARVRLVKLYDVMSSNAKEADSPKRTLSDTELQDLLDRLETEAREPEKIAVPAQLKSMNPEDFQKQFWPPPPIRG